MANKTFPELPELLAVDDETLLAADTGIQTFKLKLETVKPYMVSSIEDNIDDNIEPSILRLQNALRSNILSSYEVVGTATTLPLRVACLSYNTSLGILVAGFTSQDGTGGYANLRFLYSSDNGINWSTTNLNTSATFYSLAFNPSAPLMVACGDGTGTQRMASSTAGTSWTMRDSANANIWRYVGWFSDLGLYISCGENGAVSGQNIQTSENGTSWTQRTGLSTSSLQSIAYSPTLGILVAVGLSGGVLSSVDGITWTQRTPTARTDFYDVVWSPANSRFLAAAFDSGTGAKPLMTSVDGINWTEFSTLPNTHRLFGLCWSEELGAFVASRFLGTNTSSLIFSSDGVDWNEIQIPTQPGPNWNKCYALDGRVYLKQSGNGSTAGQGLLLRSQRITESI